MPSVYVCNDNYVILVSILYVEMEKWMGGYEH